MADLLEIYQELKNKKWVNLSHQIKEDWRRKIFLL